MKYIKEYHNLFDPKHNKISEINRILQGYGSVSTGELYLDTSPLLKEDSSGIHLIERFKENLVEVIIYGGYDNSMIINEYEVPYVDLSAELIDEIYEILTNAVDDEL